MHMLSFKRQPIKIQFAILAVPVVLAVLVVLFAAYYSILDIIRKNNSDYNTEMILQIKELISSRCELVNKIMSNIAYFNKNVENKIMATEMLHLIDLEKELNSSLLKMQEMSRSIYDIAIYSETGNSYFLNGRNEEYSRKGDWM